MPRSWQLLPPPLSPSSLSPADLVVFEPAIAGLSLVKSGVVTKFPPVGSIVMSLARYVVTFDSSRFYCHYFTSNFNPILSSRTRDRARKFNPSGRRKRPRKLHQIKSPMQRASPARLPCQIPPQTFAPKENSRARANVKLRY